MSEDLSLDASLLINQLVFDIRNFVVNTETNPHKLALECNLSPSTLRYMFEEKWNPRYDTLLAVSRHIASNSVYGRTPVAYNSQTSWGSPSVDME